jgi:tRNA pseudouridine38-40 synthase
VTGAPLPGDLARSLNGVLPEDLAVNSAEAARDGFDARRDARSRTYCYRVLNRGTPSPFEHGRALWIARQLDRDRLAECADALLGSHDFTAFTPTETDHVHFERNILRAEWVPEGHPPAADAERGASDLDDLSRAPSEQSTRAEILAFWVEADAFMRNMVRVLVGTMLEVGSGQRSAADFARLLDGAAREQAGETAPAHGLYLASVRY